MGLMSTSGAATELGTAERSDTPAAADRPGASVGRFVSRLARDETDQLESHDPRIPVPSSDPALSLALLTCMDARLDIPGRLGIAIGDAHILRNAGGRVTEDVVRSLHLSVSLMNVSEIGILHHTNCGLRGTDNDTLARRTGVKSIDFLPFKSFRDSLSADVAEVLRAGILPTGGVVWGAVYSLGTEQISVIHGPIEVTNPRHVRSRRGGGHQAH